jgi:hypothetical protein
VLPACAEDIVPTSRSAYPSTSRSRYSSNLSRGLRAAPFVVLTAEVCLTGDGDISESRDPAREATERQTRPNADSRLC